MTEEAITTALKRLTYNGAYNLVGTLKHPHEEFPDLLYGGRRLSTGLGKYTTLSTIGIRNNLRSIGLIEERYLPWNGPDEGWIKNGHNSECITPLGRAVAELLLSDWDSYAVNLREGGKR